MTFFQLGDFCGAKDSWWFKKVRDGAKTNKGPDASCETPLQMLYYFDEDYCIVDLTKDLKTDQKNKEYVSIFHNFVIIAINILFKRIFTLYFNEILFIL